MTDPHTTLDPIPFGSPAWRELYARVMTPKPVIHTMAVTCDQCGTAFERSARYVYEGKPTYCSAKCGSRAWYERNYYGNK